MEQIRKAIEEKLLKAETFEAKVLLLEEVKDLARTISRTLHRERDQALYDSEEKYGQLLSGSGGVESSTDFGKRVM